MITKQISPNVLLRYYGDDCAVLSRRDGRRVARRGGAARTLLRLAESLTAEDLLLLQVLAFDAPREQAVARVLTEALEDLDRAPVPTSVSALFRQAPGLFRTAQDERIPLFAMVELTHRCNLRCRHCFVLDRIEGRAPAQTAYADAERLLTALAEEGCLEVTLTGGEATLHPQYRTLVSAAKSLHLKVTLLTNATTFTAARAAAYASDPAHRTHCSLYGATPEVHDAFTTRPGSFAMTIEGLRHLAAVGVECQVSCLVWRGNAGQLPQMQQLVRDLGHDFMCGDVIHGRLNGDRTPLALRLSRAEHLRLAEQGRVPHFDPEPCGAGRIKVKVEPTGRIAPCELISGRGNVFETPFRTLWRQPAFAEWSEEVIRLSEAQQEGGRPRRSCPAMNALNTGSVDGPTDPFDECCANGSGGTVARSLQAVSPASQEGPRA